MRDRPDTPPEVSVVLTIPTAAIRPGQSGCEAAFAAAYNAAGGEARLGQALGEVYDAGPGWVQHFTGSPSGEPAVICALHGRTAITVAESIWNEVCAIGGGHPGSGAAGVGFPVGSRPQAPFIDPTSEEVELAGGQWGAGRLARQKPDRWIWKPDIAFDSQTTSDRDSWGTGKGDMDLRVRLAARIPVADSDLRVTGSGRERMLAALRSAPFNDVLLEAARRRGLKADALQWDETPTRTGTTTRDSPRTSRSSGDPISGQRLSGTCGSRCQEVIHTDCQAWPICVSTSMPCGPGHRLARQPRMISG